MGVLHKLPTVPLVSLGLTVWVVGAGCGHNQTAPPKSLVSEQVAPTIETAFKKARPEIREAANNAVAAIQNQDEPRAFIQLQALSIRPDLTPEQRTATARSMMTVLGRLQMAAANGNKVAEEMLKQYRASK
jgi:hypothetical protein